MPRRSRSRSRRLAGLLPFAAMACLAAVAGCVRLPEDDTISQGQLLLELSDALSELRGQDAMLQEQIDSLRVVVARQDTLLARLANATGVPVSP
ncbi:MAG TPA: hypothetical protein VFS08_16780 [Gemmatimonadaceae bacterium]|nr:hypothetical protein [Gemmatimonadaceae bacterium]